MSDAQNPSTTSQSDHDPFRIALIRPVGDATWATCPIGELQSALECTDDDDVMEVMFVHMTKAQIDGLEEFNGW